MFLRSLLILMPVLAALAAAGQAMPAQPAPTAERRVALVIGNSAYPGQPLTNPVNDAKAIAGALRQIGFEVIESENVTQKEMERAILSFGTKLKQGGVGLFYYAGHGLQVKGQNYLVPVDAKIEDEPSVRIEAVPVDLVTEQLGDAGNRLNMIILDACRNNPFERRLRGGGGRGLAAMDAASGTFVAYATAPGSVAADGDGANGLYTEELLKALREPGLKVEDVFKRVRVSVVARSRGAQTPWESSSLTGDFYFRPPSGLGQAQPPAPAPAAFDERQIELAYWDSIKDSGNAEAFQDYLRRFPKGSFVEIANLKLRELEKPAGKGGPASRDPAKAPIPPPGTATTAQPAQQQALNLPPPPNAAGDLSGKWSATTKVSCDWHAELTIANGEMNGRIWHDDHFDEVTFSTHLEGTSVDRGIVFYRAGYTPAVRRLTGHFPNLQLTASGVVNDVSGCGSSVWFAFTRVP